MIKDITGKRFGQLVAVKFSRKNKYGQSLWLCHCDCGKDVEVLLSNLTTGKTKTCKKFIKIEHGLSKSRLHRIWSAMKDRCSNPKNMGYKNYTARGISVCDEWKNSFIAFKEWALANGYKDNLTIDRIDNNGNYEPSNCRWATRNQQARNTSRTLKISFNGKTQCAVDWAKEVGISAETIRDRIQRMKWSVEKTLTTLVLNH